MKHMGMSIYRKTDIEEEYGKRYLLLFCDNVELWQSLECVPPDLFVIQDQLSPMSLFFGV